MTQRHEAYVSILYGDHVSSSYPGSLLADGYMIPCRGEIQAELEREDLGLAIALATRAPVPGNQVPEVLMAYDPSFDAAGAITTVTLESGQTLDDPKHPVVFDNHIHNFHGGVMGNDVATPRNAYGIGLPPERVWNHYTVQNLGNNKRAADAILSAEGTGIPSYSINEFDLLADTHRTSRVVYKPNGGALAQGVRQFRTYTEYRTALSQGELPIDGHIQPWYDVHQPITGLQGATREDQELLTRFNNDPTRPRELRMHIIAAPDDIRAFPVLKVGKPGVIMNTELIIGIDPDCVPEDSFIYRSSTSLGRASLEAASKSATQDTGKPTVVPQLYMCGDWLAPQGMEEEAAPRIVDANYRCPGLAKSARPARVALAQGFVQSALRQLKQTGHAK